MRIKPVGKWLLLRENKDVDEEMAKSDSKIILLDANSKSINSLIAADVLGAGDEVARCTKGDVVFFRFDSPATAPLILYGEQLWLLPEEHILAKWEPEKTKPVAKA